MADAEPVLMIFFDGMYEGSGSLLPDRIASFRALRECSHLSPASPGDQTPARARS